MSDSHSGLGGGVGGFGVGGFSGSGSGVGSKVETTYEVFRTIDSIPLGGGVGGLGGVLGLAAFLAFASSR